MKLVLSAWKLGTGMVWMCPSSVRNGGNETFWALKTTFNKSMWFEMYLLFFWLSAINKQ